MDEASSQMENLSSVRAERTSLYADLNEMTAPVEQINDNVGKFLSSVSTGAQKTHKDTAKVVKLKFQVDYVDG